MDHSPLPWCFWSFQLHLTAFLGGWSCSVVMEMDSSLPHMGGGDCNPRLWLVSGVECGLLDIYQPSNDSWWMTLTLTPPNRRCDAMTTLPHPVRKAAKCSWTFWKYQMSGPCVCQTGTLFLKRHIAAEFLKCIFSMLRAAQIKFHFPPLYRESSRNLKT